MSKSNAYQKSGNHHPSWSCLAEYYLREFKSGKETGEALRAGLQSQTIRDMDIPPECLDKIEQALLAFVNQEKLQSDQGNKIFPIVIRLFYGEKTLKSGGWGFYLIERVRDFPVGSTGDTPNFIDVFLYQEGE